MSEVEKMKKKHYKEKAAVQKSQCTAIEKISKRVDPASDPEIQNLVIEQTREWSELLEKQRQEEWTQQREHLTQQEEILKKLIKEAQALQLKQLQAKHDQETKELNSEQAK